MKKTREPRQSSVTWLSNSSRVRRSWAMRRKLPKTYSLGRCWMKRKSSSKVNTTMLTLQQLTKWAQTTQLVRNSLRTCKLGFKSWCFRTTSLSASGRQKKQPWNLWMTPFVTRKHQLKSSSTRQSSLLDKEILSFNACVTRICKRDHCQKVRLRT